MLGRGKSDPSGARRGKSWATAAWVTVELGLGAIGILLVVLGALIGRHWEGQVDNKFHEEMALSPTSEGVEEWTSPSVPIITHMYFWNWTNPKDIGLPDYKPDLQEMGPYTFREKHRKVNMTWHQNGTVSYRLMKHWYFAPELSAGSLADNITSVNVITASISAMTGELSMLQRRLLSFTLVYNKQAISWTKTVAELTFDGFSNPLQTASSYITSKAKDKFGYFYGMNGTVAPDVYTMSTGADDIYTIGDVILFNYHNSTPAHNGSCALYRGSFGELWPPHQTPHSVLTMFTPDMCRPISYYFEKESSHNGIRTLVFSSTPETVDNGTLVPDNACFCGQDGCAPSGLYDLRSCRDGAPVYMSLPHLYLADPVYRAAIHGMWPDPQLHKFFMELEPRTGVPLNVAARLQLNVKINQNRGITMFSNVKDVLVPVWWMETKVSLPATHTSGVNLLLWVIYFGPFIAGVLIAIGGVLILFLTFRRYLPKFTCRRKRKIPPEAIEGEKSVMLIKTLDSITRRSDDEQTVPVGAKLTSC